ncbi:hypothetical protein N8J89_19335 [Crossiella sp. CA-258035]|uniref:hypothetical protein n=1 Tax=Crossiella sp. CA-258035 TaxID=2981138 RepID=UPI0024BC4A92|nr:hypothetical protein [Crossiella sp. CA-258035]WHT23145.1 hypothetical protein N8J89_19335 [Crossiella sp. CA-258035]
MRRGGVFTRAGLARACAVLGILVGLVLMQESAHVEDPHSPGCHSLYSVAMLVADDCVPAQPAHGPQDPADLLGACLALLVAVLLTLVALAGPRPLTTLLAQLRAPRPPTRRHRPVPSLALLCVLRT